MSARAVSIENPSSLSRFVLRRIAGAVVLVAVVSLAALVLARLAPGDATAIQRITGQSSASIARTRAELGLDRPLYVQVGRWLAGLARFDLGTSSYFHRPVVDLVGERAPNTALLATAALALATLIGLPVGLLTGARPRGLLAAVVTPASIALVSCPPLVGALALLLFAMATGWLPSAPGSLTIPVLALALPLAATLERVQSQATAEALGSADLVAAAARGVSRRRLLWVHASRQSLRPVLGIYGIVIGSLFSGSLAVETITGWPGLGGLTRDALMGRDVYLVAGCALLGATCLAVGNLIADIARALIDPRVRT